MSEPGLLTSEKDRDRLKALDDAEQGHWPEIDEARWLRPSVAEEGNAGRDASDQGLLGLTAKISFVVSQLLAFGFVWVRFFGIFFCFQ